ncbi:MAG: heme o synthase [candidate division Zixibacteria bacterium]|nr:heme o synthase [candidate division Zixibacteria bacterium]
MGFVPLRAAGRVIRLKSSRCFDNAMSTLVRSCVQLTKPSVMTLVVTSGVTALVLEGTLLASPLKFAAFLAGLFLTGGCANSLNQYLERDIDSRMSRTCGCRPLPLRALTASQALTFSIIVGLVGVLLLALVFNWLTALLALAVIMFYGFVYTLWLKPTTSQNIVIGGIAGAMAPVGAWAAATGSTALMPWLLFLIILVWTPPHFWALAVHFKDDYRRAGLPMLPVARGDRAALNGIFYYTVALFAVSLLPLAVNFGWIYLAASLILGVIFVEKAYKARRHNQPHLAWGIFRYSILYLFFLFLALIMDKFI